MKYLIRKIKKITPRQYLETALVMLILCLCFFLKTHKLDWLWAGLILAGLLIISKRFFMPFTLILLLVGEAVGNVVSVIVLLLLFFLLITPIAVVRRIMRKNDLRLGQFKKDRHSVFESRDHEYTAADLQYPF